MLSRIFIPPVKSALFLVPAILILCLVVSCTRPAGSALVSARSQKTPVIFDTDICDDIDDTWALVLLLKCPEFDVKLITTTVGDTRAKAKVVAKLLEIADRTDIPIGIGVPAGTLLGATLRTNG